MGRRKSKRKAENTDVDKNMPKPSKSQKTSEEISAILSPEEIAAFEADGYILLKNAFSPELAMQCRDLLWDTLEKDGIMRHDPSTWTLERKGIPECYSGGIWDEILNSTRLSHAISQLCGGSHKIVPYGLGWWVINFPGFHSAPWGSAGKWHIDGSHYRHHLNSAESGLLPIFLFSSIKPGAGGTALRTGSHKVTAQVLRASEPRGLKGSDLSKKVNALTQDTFDVTEVVGEAGDVMLTHPFLLHARSKNCAELVESNVRFMCNPNIALRNPMRISRTSKKSVHSPVERARY